jgi:hypothetical protein
LRVRTEELAPAEPSPRVGGRHSGLSQDRPNRCRSDLHTRTGKLADDPLVSPARVLTGNDPMAGTALNDQFKPNYVYLAAKEYIPALPGLGSMAYKFHVPEWAVRSVSGLKTTKVVSRSGNNASEIVLFYDRSPSYHQYHKTDIYAGQSGDYFASYCYLDGHADGRGYSNWNDYMKVFHNPIPQAWFGQDFPTLFPAEYGEYAADAAYQH